MILGTLGVVVAPVLALALTVATTSAAHATLAAASPTWFTISCSTTLVDTALLGR